MSEVVRPAEKRPRRDPVPTFNALDFIADLLYQADSRKKGYAAGVRWWCHGARGGRRHWRKVARETITKWAEAERSTMENQNRSAREFFK